MRIRVVSNKEIAKLTYPLLFIVPPNSQAIDIVGLISAFTRDKNLKLLLKLIKKLNWGYEKIILDYLNGKLHQNLRELLNNIYMDAETFNEKELEKKLIGIFDKHRELLEKVFVIRKLPEQFTFIIYKAEFVGKFEGFEKPIIVIITKNIDEIAIIRAFLVWYFRRVWNLDSGFTESVLEYVLWANYRHKLGLITKEQRDKIIEDFVNYNYWLFESFGDWPRKLYFLKDYDFSKNVWEWMKERTSDRKILSEIKKVYQN